MKRCGSGNLNALSMVYNGMLICVRFGQGGPPVVPDPNTFVEDEWNRYNEMYFAFIDLELEKFE